MLSYPCPGISLPEGRRKTWAMRVEVIVDKLGLRLEILRRLGLLAHRHEGREFKWETKRIREYGNKSTNEVAIDTWDTVFQIPNVGTRTM
jgi:hypothetical protein